MAKFLTWLRVLRIAASVAVFIGISAQFFDMYNMLAKPYWMRNPVGTQFVPSLLEMLGGAGVLAGAAFITFSVCALVFGRAYCSCFCPFGILMDILRRISLWISKIPFIGRSALGKALKSTLKMKFAPARNVLRCVFLCLAALLIALGATSLLGFIDPYSLYGKVMGAFVHPAIAALINGTSAVLSEADIYWISAVSGNAYVSLAAFSAAGLILFCIWVASALRARLYCNTICPVGAWLGLLSKFSAFKVQIDHSACVKCGLCERSCKTQCIDAKNGLVDFSRCVLCFNCAKSCKKNAIRIAPNGFWKGLSKRLFFKNANGGEFSADKSASKSVSRVCGADIAGAKNSPISPMEIFARTGESHGGNVLDNLKNPGEKLARNEGKSSVSRRRFAFSFGALAATLALGAKKYEGGGQGRGRGLGLGEGRGKGSGHACAEDGGSCKNFDVDQDASPFGLRGARPDKRLGVPAGAGSIENFLEKCTGCQICTAACKSKILKPSFGEWGLSGLMQPYMDFTDGYCLYTCHACTVACPTGAIKFLTSKDKRKVKTGTAKFKRFLCVVKTDGTDCAACAEHCPVQAIEMIPFKGKNALYIPHVHEDVCIGCGACEYICPVRPHKAIVVQGLSAHRPAVPWDDSMRVYKLPRQKPQPAQDSSNPFPF